MEHPQGKSLPLLLSTGDNVGVIEGNIDGAADGFELGVFVGDRVGELVGFALGLMVGGAALHRAGSHFPHSIGYSSNPILEHATLSSKGPPMIAASSDWSHSIRLPHE